MKTVILGILFTAIILLGKIDIYSQSALPKKKSCQPPTEEILSVIKSAFNLLPHDEKILIAGEIRAGAQYLPLPE